MWSTIDGIQWSYMPAPAKQISGGSAAATALTDRMVSHSGSASGTASGRRDRSAGGMAANRSSSEAMPIVWSIARTSSSLCGT